MLEKYAMQLSTTDFYRYASLNCLLAWFCT